MPGFHAGKPDSTLPGTPGFLLVPLDEEGGPATINSHKTCLPKWRNWQTRQVQDLVSFGTWRFESSLRHSKQGKDLRQEVGPCPVAFPQHFGENLGKRFGSHCGGVAALRARVGKRRRHRWRRSNSAIRPTASSSCSVAGSLATPWTRAIARLLLLCAVASRRLSCSSTRGRSRSQRESMGCPSSRTAGR
jgi:hypothetical protein